MSVASATKLLEYYFKRGLLNEGRKLFAEMPERDVVAWTTTITGYVSLERHHDATKMFLGMKREGVHPNAFTFSSALKACSGLSNYWLGSLIHGCALKDGLEVSAYVENALLDMYLKCNCMHHALMVFDGIQEKTAVSWTTMIAGYDRRGNGKVALRLFQDMLSQGIELNHFSCSIALRASGSMELLVCGEQIHGAAIKLGYDNNVPVGNAAIDMYARCACLRESRKVFDEMLQRDLITWNTMISVYEKFSLRESLDICFEMEKYGLRPNCFTFTSVVTACSRFSALVCGELVHGRTLKSGFCNDLPFANALIDMYAKGGNVNNARKVFDESPHRDLVSWTSLLMGYGKHGYGKEAIELFQSMTSSGVHPDHVAFLGVLCACSHAGLVDYGLSQFHSMSTTYSLHPKQEHYACVVDMLGRAGKLGEAFQLIQSMPVKADDSVWGALLGACRIFCSPSLGSLVAQKILRLRPEQAGTYILLSNIFADTGQWSELARTRRLMKEHSHKKEVGKSWIEVKNQVHVFVAGDTDSPHTELLYEELKKLYRQMMGGHLPSLDTLLHHVEDVTGFTNSETSKT